MIKICTNDQTHRIVYKVKAESSMLLRRLSYSSVNRNQQKKETFQHYQNSTSGRDSSLMSYKALTLTGNRKPVENIGYRNCLLKKTYE